MSESDILSYSLSGVALLIFLVCVVWGLRPWRRTGLYSRPFADVLKARRQAAAEASRRLRERGKKKDEPMTASGADSTADSYVIEDDECDEVKLPRVRHDIDPALLPPVTVVVYSFINEERFGDYLDSLMVQDYPEFEVVVVYDATAEAASEMADRFMSRYPNLHLTFIPPQTHNLSRRKLAFTLGIKAAETDIVVTTQANARIPSRDWLYTMMAPFADPSTDVVLGVSRLDFADFTGSSRWYRQYDAVVAASSWISAAGEGKAYRGDSSNMAFRRGLFFGCNGYAATIGKPFGEDDVFVAGISSGANTRLVLAPQNLLTLDWGLSADRVSVTMREHRLFADRMLRKGPALLRGLPGTCSWGVLLCCAAGIALSLTTFFGALPTLSLTALGSAVAALAILIALWVFEIAAYRRCATSLEAVRLWWAVPLFCLWHPVENMIFRIRHRKAAVIDFVWNGYQ